MRQHARSNGIVAAMERHQAKESLGGKRTITLWLPIPTPSQNEYGQWHWAKRHKWSQQIELALKLQLNAMGWTKPEKPRRMAVRVTRYSSGTLDVGNFIGGAKGLLDALVRLGVLHDDSPAWCTVLYAQGKARRGLGRTVVEVTGA